VLLVVVVVVVVVMVMAKVLDEKMVVVAVHRAKRAVLAARSVFPTASQNAFALGIDGPDSPQPPPIHI